MKRVLDERQREHLTVGDALASRAASLPRVGATYMSRYLFQGYCDRLMMSQMTEAEEAEFRAQLMKRGRS